MPFLFNCFRLLIYQPVRTKLALPFFEKSVRPLEGSKNSSLGLEKAIRILAGQYFDGETGLSYNRFRYYSAANGRYLRDDPIGLSGGLNVYSFAQNNTLKYSDQLGLCVTIGCFPSGVDFDRNVTVEEGDWELHSAWTLAATMAKDTPFGKVEFLKRFYCRWKKKIEKTTKYSIFTNYTCIKACRAPCGIKYVPVPGVPSVKTLSFDKEFTKTQDVSRQSMPTPAWPPSNEVNIIIDMAQLTQKERDACETMRPETLSN